MVKRILITVGLISCTALLHGAAGDENWESGFTLPPGLDGPVYATATIGSDLYAGGSFELGGTVTVRSIARWDGTNWHALGEGVRGVVYALAAEGTNLYVGGQFDRAGSVPAINLARWNGSEWQAIGDVSGEDAFTREAPSFGMNGAKVMTLLATTNRLVVGGNFRQAGGVAATNIAAMEGTTWASFGPGLGNHGGQVHALAMFRGQLFAGGVFQSSGERAITNIARWAGTNWHHAGAGLIGPAFDYWTGSNVFLGSVNTLAVHGKKLLAGGVINQSGKARLVNLASFSGSKWKAVKGGIGITNIFASVDAITVHGKHAYIAGTFDRAGGVDAANIVRFDGKRWATLGSGLGGPGRALTVVGTNLYAGGVFGLAGGVSAAYIAGWNMSSNAWFSLGEGVGNTLIEHARTLAASGNTVYGAGPIHTAGTNHAHNVAQWTGSNWFVPTPGFIGDAAASAVVGSNYYVAGRLVVESAKATNIACWDGFTWSALPPLLDTNGQPAVVYAMVSSGTILYVAGNFSTAGGVPATNIVAWTGSNWVAMGDAPAASVGSKGLPLVANAHYLYVLSTSVNNSGAEVDSIHRWDGTNWFSLGAPNGSGRVRSVALFGSIVHVASIFEQQGETATTKLDRYFDNKWEAVNWPFGRLGYVPILAATDSYLYAGGPWDYTASSSPGIARFDGANWAPLGSGLVDTDGFGAVEAIVASGKRVYVSGFFKTAGGKPSYRFAIYNEP